MSLLNTFTHDYTCLLHPNRAVHLRKKVRDSLTRLKRKKNKAFKNLVDASLKSHRHARDSIPGHLEVRPSGVHGRGVFCSKDFKKDEYILILTGSLLPCNLHRAKTRNLDLYTYQIYGMGFIDGLLMQHDDKCNIGKYINSATHSDLVNCKILQHDFGLLFTSATRDLSQGDELLLDYLVD